MADTDANIEAKQEEGWISLERERRKIKQMKFIFALFSTLLILTVILTLVTNR